MSNTTGPRHAEERSKSQKSAARKTTIGYETPITKKPMRPSSRLGPVHSATPTRKTFGGGGSGYASEFLKARRRRQFRHASRLAKVPRDTLIVGGVNPFEQRDVREACKKFREVVAQKFFKGGIGEFTPAKSSNKLNNATQKLVFREEEEEENMEVDEEESVILIAGGGDGQKKANFNNNNNRTIVIDD